MDLISIYKKQKQDEDDMISKLPDELILHIFSFLPMKDTVSSRWEYVWMSIPNFGFHAGDDGCDEKITNFVNFVDRSMSIGDSTIKQFSLGCYRKIDALYFRRWITAAIKRNVEDMSIEVGAFLESFNFPKCLFASKSLTKLSLSMYCTLNFPPLVSLSNLKHLNLEIVTFPANESTKTLLSGCPALETLRLVACFWLGSQLVCISAPKLWKLEIYKEPYEYVGEVCGCNSCNVVIDGPSLKFFHYEGFFFNHYSLHNAPSLDECSVEMKYAFEDDDDGHISSGLYKLLKGISMLKKLSLSTQVVETLGNAVYRLPHLPLFINLSVLSFGRTKTDIDSVAFMKMLQNSPCLEILRFEKGIKLSSGCKEEEVLEPVPPCFLSCLKRIEVFFDQFYEDREVFVDAVKILLARAAVLEKLMVYLHRSKGGGEERALLLYKELMELQKVSQLFELEFDDSIMRPLWLKAPFSYKEHKR